jgi:hypothetical protein
VSPTERIKRLLGVLQSDLEQWEDDAKETINDQARADEFEAQAEHQKDFDELRPLMEAAPEMLKTLEALVRPLPRFPEVAL